MPTSRAYNAQAATNERQIVVAAEISVDGPDFGHLEPMVEATVRELDTAGVSEAPEVVVADAGYWHHEQMDALAGDGIEVLIPPDSGKRKGTRRAGRAAATPGCDGCSPPSSASASTENAHRRSSRCSDTPSTTGGWTACNDEADRPCGPSGA